MMLGILPTSLAFLVFAIASASAQRLKISPSNPRSGVDLLPPTALSRRDTNNNGSQFIWTLQDAYEGSTFFDTFDFWNDTDPTHGLVHYVNQSFAFANNLSYVDPNTGKVVMKGDDTTWLPLGVNRSSVRISSQKTYNSGSLFILDVDRAPWGCGVWPAFWTVGDGWPWNGEIDIIEGVHDNEHNQVTWHTSPADPGCWLTNATSNFTGNALGLNCNSSVNNNAGCAIEEWSRASYGPYFESQGGGVFAMKWDENDIAVYSFYRSAIPQDIVNGAPDTSGWGLPVAKLGTNSCNFTEYFAWHRIVFDITFCGDWAGNSYASAPNCPGTCEERLLDPGNFVNASWVINSLKVYNKVGLTGPAVRNTAGPRFTWNSEKVGWAICAAVLSVMFSITFVD